MKTDYICFIDVIQPDKGSFCACCNELVKYTFINVKCDRIADAGSSIQTLHYKSDSYTLPLSGYLL